MELAPDVLRRRKKKLQQQSPPSPWRPCLLAGLLVAVSCSLVLSVAALAVWSCASSMPPAQCKKKKKKHWVYVLLAALGLFPGPPHRCPVPGMRDPDSVRIPELKRSVAWMPPNLTYIVEPSSGSIGFGGNQTWQQREESFAVKANMKVHCGFAEGNGPELFSPEDREFARRCRFVVATCIVDDYDRPHEPSNVSRRAKEVFCFVMVADRASVAAFRRGGLLSMDEERGQWVGTWRVLELQSLAFSEARRNGKVPKLLLHRLFPEVQFSVWIDGKLELVADPISILERYLWREKQSFAIAQHKHHRSVYDEADACKRRKRYARPLIDRHMDAYRNEGLQPWSPAKLPLQSDVPEGALIVREHTPMTNLFGCLWFNEVTRFTARDQLSFGYVLHRLQVSRNKFRLFMFRNCEYNSLVVLHKHVREHSSKLEWVKRMDQLKDLTGTLQ